MNKFELNLANTMEDIINKTIKLLHCDTARIVTTRKNQYLINEKMFMVIGYNQNTKNEISWTSNNSNISGSQWFKNGESYDFDYVKENVIANGRNYEELWESIKEYKELLITE